MRCSLAVALFIAPLMRGLAPLGAQAASGTKAEIRALEREWFEAARAADTAAFDRLIASDEREVISNGSVHGRTDRLHGFGSGAVRTPALELFEERVRLDGSMAVATGLAVGRDSLRNGTIHEFRFRYMHVWEHRDGRWQLVEFQSTSVQPEPAANVVNAVPSSERGAREAVLALEHERQQALLHGDADALSRILADDFVEVTPNGGRSKDVNVDDLRSGRIRFTSVAVTNEQVTMFDSTAAVTGVFDAGGTSSGTPFTRHFRYIRIYVSRSGHWQNVAAANVPLPP